ncbi:MAG: VOC family protein [Mycolicibacterium hassiacum]|nr:MAG: bleomycin resistance protein [Mycolicibacterium hassiacum]
MTAILNAEDLYHTGVVVADLDAAMARLSAIGGYEWTAPLEFSLPVRIADTDRTVDFRFAYSLQAPHLELVQQIPGTIWTPVPGNAAHHLGYFVDDVAAVSERLAAAGFEREACVVGEGGAAAAFAYHIDAAGVRIEIVERALFGDFGAFLEQNRP